MSDNPSLSLFWYLSFPDLAVEAASYFGIYPCRALSTSWFFALNRCFRIILHFFSPDLDSDCSSSSPASFPWRMVFRSPDMGNECAHCSCHIDATSHRKNVYLCVCILTCVYIYTHTHVYIHTHTHTHTHTHGLPLGASLVVQMVKNLPTMQDPQFWSLGWIDPLEMEMATHSSILAWKTPWTEEPVGLQSMGSQRVGHDLVTKQRQYI